MRDQNQRTYAISDEGHRDLAKIARERGLSVSALVRTTMMTYVIQPWRAEQAKRERE